MGTAHLSGSDVSVIICAFTEKRWDKLVAAVNSVKSQTLSVSDVILVIDHNHELYERASKEFVGVTVVENKETSGLSGARNTGIGMAKGNYIAFLDDDAVAAKDWLESLCKHLTDETILGVGGASVPVWQTSRPAWFPEEFLWIVGCSYRGLPECVAPVRNPMGGCTCWRKEIFVAVGNFDSTLGRVGSLPAGCEETELSIRATQHWPGRKFLFDPAAKIYHFVPENRSNISYFFSRCYSEGISKAVVAHLVGHSDGLSSERAYTLKVLPVGILRGLADALHGDLNGIGRAIAIVGGLAVTTLGYLVGCLQRSWPVKSFKARARSIK